MVSNAPIDWSREIQGRARLQRDPMLFLREALGVKHLWSKMEEIGASVRDHDRTAVKACHSSSKTFTAARLALWWLYSYGPRSTVVTTAPTDQLVEQVLWREIRQAFVEAPYALPGKPSLKRLDAGGSEFPKWFAIGFSTRPDTVTQQATAFQGYHNDNVLVIFDEAAGILPQIWEAAESLLASGHTRFLAIGNPTSGFGRFPDAFRPDSGFNQITISAYDSPNYQQDKEIIPGLIGRRYVQQARDQYGENSNYFKARVLGEIPDYTEGSIYGKVLMSLRERGRMRSVEHDPAALVHTAWDLGIADATAIWFFQVVGAGEIHWIDYVEGSGDGLIHYVQVLDKMRLERGYMYGQHFAPHDIQQRELTTASTRLESARKLGINFTPITRHSLPDGIEATRQILDRSYFDSLRCIDGLRVLAEYRWRKLESLSSDDRPVYSNNPEHDWASHGADALRTGAMAIQTMSMQSRSSQTKTGNYQSMAAYYKRMGA